MKKILDFLEKNVQWMVLSVSLLYVVYMAWTYLLRPPVAVKVESNVTVGPGEIDQWIYENKVADLEKRVRGTSPTTAPTPPSFSAKFRDSMNYASEPVQPLANAGAIWPRTPSLNIGDMPGPGGQEEIVRPGPAQNQGGPVAELPAIPAARLGGTRTGMSYVVPGPPPAANNPAPIAAVGGTDKTWAGIRFEIDTVALAKEWDEKKIPALNSNTMVLQVVLERQELDPAGNWSPTSAVQTVSLEPLEPMPADNAGAKAMLDYAKWAAQHQRDILQPKFYTVAKGDQWNVPGLNDAGVADNNNAKFDPTKYIKATRAEKMKLTPQQRQLVQQEIEKANKKAAPPRPAPRKTIPIAPGGGVPAEFAPNDPDRPTSYQVRRSNPPPTTPDAVDTPEDMAQQQGNAPAAPTTPSAQPTTPAASPSSPGKVEMFACPNAEMDPHKWVADHSKEPNIVCWAIDDTVEPGHVYKYRVSYKVKNPVFVISTAVRNPKLAEVFALTSEPSEWSSEIEVPSILRFWIAHASKQGTVAVQIFRRQEGELKTKTFDLGPGDPVGSKEGDVDFLTDWTIVDVRTDPRTTEPYVLLMDKFGILHRRNVIEDSADPNFINARQKASVAVLMAK